jgi:ABC-2 type transport system permease protein
VDLMIFEATARKKVEVWGSIVLLFRDRESETIDLAARYPQGYEGLSGLEYELSSRIWQLSNDKPTLGITGHLASAPPNANPMNPAAGQPRPMFQGLRRVLGDAFTIQDVDLNQAELDPKKIPCLMVVRPKEFNDVQQFRLDQYMMKGGRVLMFITLGERGPGGMGGGGMQLKLFQTGLEDWMGHHGARVPPEFVLHYRACYPVPVPAQVAPGVVQDVMIPCPFFPIISRDMENCLADDNPAIQSLRSTVFLWAHPVDVIESALGKDVQANVLVRSSEKQSWRWKDMNRISPEAVLRGIQSGTDTPTGFFSSPIIVAFEGEFDSFYASNPVPAALKSDAEKKDDGAKEDDATTLEEDKESDGASSGPDVIKKSVKTQLVIVGNSFFISDLLLGGNSRDDRGKEAALVAFNLVDWLARSSELIALRAKKYTNRDLSDSVEDTLDGLEAEYTEGTITADEFKQRLNDAQDEQKAKRKKWRWMNSLVPGGAILLIGLVVWILRLAFRATSAGVPEAQAPEGESA